MTPAYDCGDPECGECQRAFGPDRTKAIANYRAREKYYTELEGADCVRCCRCGDLYPLEVAADGCRDPDCAMRP